MIKIFQILFLLVVINSNAQEQILEKGIKWIDYSNQKAFQKNSEFGYLKSINFTNDEGSVFESETITQPKFIWNISVKVPTNDIVLKKGQTILLQFKAKTIFSNIETGEARILWIVKQSSDGNNGYKFNLEATTSISKEWQTYYIPFTTTKDVPADELSMVMQLGFPKQKFELTNLQAYVFPPNFDISLLPKTKITYSGMDADASWRKEAESRIEKNRKGDFTITFKNGNHPVANENVSIQLEKHDFSFGAALNAEEIVNEPEHLNYFSKMFNIGVFENDLKIKKWQNKKRRETVLKAIDILNNAGIKVKGHTLLWPGFRYLTDAFKENENNPEKIIELNDAFLVDVLKLTKGKISHWDVTNENYTNKELQKITGSNQIIYDAFLKTKALDPNAERFINEYGIISSGGIDKEKQDWYFNYIKELDVNTNNAVDGIGMQSHIGSDLTPITSVYSIIDRFATLNKKISISEFTMDITDTDIRYKYTNDFLTIAFSHPAVSEFLFWGYYMPNNPKGGLFTKDFKLTAMGKAFYNLVHNKWKTKLFEKTNNEGKVLGRGFYGFYSYKINFNGKQYTGVIHLSKGGKNNYEIDLQGK
ncbi:MAG: hypothetical protein CMP76_16820 [Flavobacterium sp.]|uniref:endo-1,4-beta-xylanase n=1 Tax=Flavobacterium sp. TaxID=239 RepID=UPI000C58C4FD|nr:endo-1,4-beta-xylanase [Flavobacterium sp.]MBF04945.1 hypothetical protein [Flavobacterium sp.]|tara:strand:+ start:2984 stop:4759 length:1776 start_codon:yes stop_codon:yes gene_type:complete